MFVDVSAVAADLHAFTTLSLRRSYEFDPAVAVPGSLVTRGLEKGSEHTQLLQTALACGRTQLFEKPAVRRSVVDVQHQRLPAPLADPLTQAGPAHQIG